MGYIIVLIMISGGQPLGQLEKSEKQKLERFHFDWQSGVWWGIIETIQEINKTDSIFQSDKLDSELRILYWIFYKVCVKG